VRAKYVENTRYGPEIHLKFLDFEQPIAELEAKIEELRFVGDDSEININEEVARLRDKSETLTKSIFSKLSAWQIAQVARHPMRIARRSHVCG
jgi:acetyl-CoA carboxylase carboxyl transferase subunit alpha